LDQAFAFLPDSHPASTIVKIDWLGDSMINLIEIPEDQKQPVFWKMEAVFFVDRPSLFS